MGKIKAEEVFDEFRELRDERADWAETAMDDRQYYLGNQITDEIKKILESRGQAPLVIQRTKPAIDHQLAILMAQMPGPRFFAVNEGDEAVNQAMNDLHYWNWHQNYGNFQVMKAYEFALTMGLGVLHTWPDSEADWGRGEVKFKYEHPLFVYPDATTKDFLWRDARMIDVVTYATAETWKGQFPEYAKEIDKLPTLASDDNDMESSGDLAETGRLVYGDGTGTKHKHELIRRIDRYCRVNQQVLVVLDMESYDYHFLPPESLDDPMLRSLADQGQIRMRLVNVMRPYRQIFLGEELEVGGDFCPGLEYPVVPLHGIYTEKPWGMSETSQLFGMQDFLNKAFQQLIYHTSVSSNLKIFYEQGGIDEALWEKRYTQPGALLPYKRNYNPPKEVEPSQLQMGLLALMSNIKYDMEYATGTFAFQQGDAAQAPITYRGTLTLDEMGNRKLVLKKLMFDASLAQLGVVNRDHIQQVYSGPKSFRILRKNGEVGEVSVNQPQGGEEETPKWNDIANTSFDMVIEIGKMRASSRMAEAAFYMELAGQGIVDGKAVRDKLDLEDRDEIEQRMEQVEQLRQLAEEQQKYIEQIENDLEKSADTEEKMERRYEIERFRVRLEKILTDAKAAVRVAQTKDEAEVAIARARQAAASVKPEE